MQALAALLSFIGLVAAIVGAVIAARKPSRRTGVCVLGGGGGVFLAGTVLGVATLPPDRPAAATARAVVRARATTPARPASPVVDPAVARRAFAELAGLIRDDRAECDVEYRRALGSLTTESPYAAYPKLKVAQDACGEAAARFQTTPPAAITGEARTDVAATSSVCKDAYEDRAATLARIMEVVDGGEAKPSTVPDLVDTLKVVEIETISCDNDWRRTAARFSAG